MTANNFLPANRLILWTIAIYLLLAFTGNIIKFIAGPETATYILLLMAAQFIYFFFIGVIIWGVRKRKWAVSSWGFTLGMGAWISAVLIAVFTGIIVIFGGAYLSLHHTGIFATLIAVSFEELVFRVYLLSILFVKFGTSRKWVFASIMLMAVLFALIHVPNKTMSGLYILFFGSLLLGYIFYFTRSVLLPLFLHAWYNTAYDMGLMGGIIIIIVYLIVAVIGHNMEKKRKGI